MMKVVKLFDKCFFFFDQIFVFIDEVIIFLFKLIFLKDQVFSFRKKLKN